MTNLEVRNFAYDIIAKHLIENYGDFPQEFYNAMREGTTMEHAIESFMNARCSGDTGVVIRDFAAQFIAKSSLAPSSKRKTIARVCDIIADSIGVVTIVPIGTLTNILNIRDNHQLGFISTEECANKIVDILKDECCSPSIHLIDSLFKCIGLPRFVDCVDNSTIYLSR